MNNRRRSEAPCHLGLENIGTENICLSGAYFSIQCICFDEFGDTDQI